MGDCACAVIGDGGSISVSGTGSVLDPYVVSYDGDGFATNLPQANPDLCTTATEIVARLEGGTLARIPAWKRCAVIL